MVFQGKGSIEYADKTDIEKGGRIGKCWHGWQGGGAVKEMMRLANKRERGSGGGRRGHHPLFLVDMICEEGLI